MTIFQPGDLQRHVDRALAAIPDGRKGALVAYYTLDGRFKVTVAQRIGESWSLGVTFERDQANGRISGGVDVRGYW